MKKLKIMLPLLLLLFSFVPVSADMQTVSVTWKEVSDTEAIAETPWGEAHAKLDPQAYEPGQKLIDILDRDPETFYSAGSGQYSMQGVVIEFTFPEPVAISSFYFLGKATKYIFTEKAEEGNNFLDLHNGENTFPKPYAGSHFFLGFIAMPDGVSAPEIFRATSLSFEVTAYVPDPTPTPSQNPEHGGGGSHFDNASDRMLQELTKVNLSLTAITVLLLLIGFVSCLDLDWDFIRNFFRSGKEDK